MLEKKNLDSLFTIIKYRFPIQRTDRLNDKGLIEMFQPEHLITRSQDLEDSFQDAGQFYSFNVNNLVSKQKLLTELTGCIEVSEMEGQCIDNLVDWQLAELKYKKINA